MHTQLWNLSHLGPFDKQVVKKIQSSQLFQKLSTEIWHLKVPFYVPKKENQDKRL